MLWKNVALKNSDGSIEIYEINQAEEEKRLTARIVYDNEGVNCKMIGEWSDREKEDWAEFVEKVGARHAAWKAAGSEKPLTLQDRVVAHFFKKEN